MITDYNGKVCYRNPIDRISGYAAAGREYVYCMLANKVDVGISLFASNEDSALLSLDEKDYLIGLIRSEETSDVVISNMVPSLWKRFEGKKNIGFLFWETEGFPRQWVKDLSVVDKYWVCWDETRSSLINVGIPESKISVVPPVVNTNIFNPVIQCVPLDTDRTFNFVSVFQLTYRKGTDILLKSYWEEFDAHEDVCLVLKAYGANSSSQQHYALKEWILNLKKTVNKTAFPKIVFRSAGIANNAFPNFLKSADVFVLPSRGEGLGLPMLQSMACGVPVITTGWGAQTQFVNDDNGWLVDYEKINVTPMAHSVAYEPDQMWVEPQKKSLKKLMREAYENKDIKLEKGIKARKFVESNNSYEAAGKIIVRALL